MKLQNLQAEITHEGENVIIQFSIPATSFNSFINSLKAIKKPTLTVAAVVDPEQAKQKLLALVKDYQAANPAKYPRGIYITFMKYWSEPNFHGKRLRWEAETYFEIGRRLSTFWAKVTPEEKNKMWEEHNKSNSNYLLFQTSK